MASNLFEFPPEVRTNFYFEDQTLYYSEVLSGNVHLSSIIEHAKRRKVTTIQKLSVQDFGIRFGTAAQGGPSDANSEIQDYALKVFRNAHALSATDIHILDLGNYGLIKLRRMGLLKVIKELEGPKVKSLINVIYGSFIGSGSGESTFVKTNRQEGRILNPKYLPKDVQSMRVHTEPLECSQEEPGTLMAIRLLYDMTDARGGLDERMKTLGYEDQHIQIFRNLTERSGMTIISGPMGSGKSTMLKHFMEAQALEHPGKSFLSIEDPSEYPLQNVNQVRVLTKDHKSNSDSKFREDQYINAIAGAMRSDSNVLMIGEIRFPEAASAALDAAQTGHAVAATLHANSALGIIRRLLSLLNKANYPDPLEYLCDFSILSGLIYQRLVPVLCPNCKMPLLKKLDSGSEDEKKHITKVLPKYTWQRMTKVINEKKKLSLDAVHVKGPGCDICKKLGFVRQTVAAEVIETNEDFLNFVRHGEYKKAHESWIKDMSGKTFLQHAIEGIAKGELDPHTTQLSLGVPLDFSREISQKDEDYDDRSL